MSKEAMKLALEALLINCGGNTEGKGKEAITALREALATQPTQQIADSPDDWSDWRVIPPQSQPAPMIRGDIRDGLVDDEPAHQHIGHCLWARNGNQPCPHVQPAQQEPVAIALNTGTKQGVKWLKNVEHGEHLYTSPPAQRKPLTEYQKWRMYEAGPDMPSTAAGVYMRAVDDTEAAHGIKGDT